MREYYYNYLKFESEEGDDERACYVWESGCFVRFGHLLVQ